MYKSSCLLLRVRAGILVLALFIGSIPAQAATASRLVGLDADLELSIGLGAEEVTVGEVVTISVGVLNHGPQSAHTIAVHYALPEGLVFVGSRFSDATDTYDPETGVWVIGTLSMDQLSPVPMAQLEVVARVTEEGVSQHTAEVITSSHTDPDSTPANGLPGEDDQATALLTAQLAGELDVQLYLEAPGIPVVPGEAVTYTLHYLNAGLAATGVVLQETLPVHTTFDASGSTPGWTPIGNDQYQLALGDLEEGASGTVVFRVQVTDNLPAEVAALTNTAVIADDGSQGADATPSNNEAVVVTPLARDADLSVTLTTDQSAVPVGEEVTLTLTVANDGPTTATGVEIAVMLAEGLTLVAYTGAGSYHEALGQWTVDTVPVGTTHSLELRVEVRGAGQQHGGVFIRAADQRDPDSEPGEVTTGEDDEASLVVEGVLANPSPESPTNGATVMEATVELTWQAVAGAAQYNVQVAVAGAAFQDPVFSETVEGVAVEVGGLASDTHYEWRVRGVAGVVEGPWSDVSTFTMSDASVGVETEGVVARPYLLTPAYPNPFNPETTIQLTVQQAQDLTVVVFDMQGRQVAVLHRGVVSAGSSHVFQWRAGNLPSGLYFIRVVGEKFVETRRVTLIK